jgi:tRNA threonylcarbamoyladenosine biosynthesis protein TsaE
MTQTAEMRQFESHSGPETIAVGHRIAEMLVPQKFLILRGDLGAGKTTLVKGIAEALEAADPDEVTSPTFTLIHEYEGTRAVDGRREPVMLYHLDL